MRSGIFRSACKLACFFADVQCPGQAFSLSPIARWKSLPTRNSGTAVWAIPGDTKDTQSPPTMLRYTCRLRDYFENRGFLVEADNHDQAFKSRRHLWMREAEFVSGGAGFPGECRWETFGLNFGGYSSSPLYDANDRPGWDVVPFYDATCPGRIWARATAGLQVANEDLRKITILWLSPMDFVTTDVFFIGSKFLRCFDLSCTERCSERKVRFTVYSMLSFESNASFELSSLAMKFVQHLVEFLPADYFSEFDLAYRSASGITTFPLDSVLQFLSIIPRKATVLPGTYMKDQHWTRFRLDGQVGGEKLRRILSHQLHPNSFLQFAGFAPQFEKPFSVKDFIDLLEQIPYRGAIELPPELYYDYWADHSPFCYKKITFQSKNLTIFHKKRSIVPALPATWLPIILTNLQVSEIKVDALETDCSEQQSPELRSFIGPCFSQPSPVERFTIRFFFQRSEEHGGVSVDQRRKWAQRSIPPCTSQNLCFFNGLFSFFHISDIHRKNGWEYRVAPRSIVDDEIRSLDRVKQWDEEVFPSVVLNYCSIHLPRELERSVIPSAIKAVNDGNIYRKTTDHVPFDMSIANAGLIFRILITGARNYSGFNDG
jgi:hypothetical protein